MYGQTMLISSRHKSDVVRLVYQLKDFSISTLTHPMPLGSVLALSQIFRPILG